MPFEANFQISTRGKLSEFNIIGSSGARRGGRREPHHGQAHPHDAQEGESTQMRIIYYYKKFILYYDNTSPLEPFIKSRAPCMIDPLTLRMCFSLVFLPKLAL